MMIDLEGKRDRLIGNYDWSPDGMHLLIDQNSGQAPRRWIYVVSAEDGSVREVWRDANRQRSYTTPWNSAWQSDGEGILFLSDLDGYIHLYALSLDDREPKQLTEGSWSIVAEQGYSPSHQSMHLLALEVVTHSTGKRFKRAWKR